MKLKQPCCLRSVAGTLALLLLVSVNVFAEDYQDIDPVAVSPNNYRFLLENDYIRVVEFFVQAGEKDNLHTHPAKLSYVVEGGMLRITTAEGRVFDVEEKTNTVRWFSSVGGHFVENVGNTSIRVIYVEVKNLGNMQQDLNKFDAQKDN